jgi:hypothetical protein
MCFGRVDKLTNSYQTRMEVSESDKHASLLLLGGLTFYSTGPLLVCMLYGP